MKNTPIVYPAQSHVRDRGRFGGELFGQVSALVRNSGFSAFEQAIFLCMTIRAVEQRGVEVPIVRCSPSDLAADCRISRTSAAKALDGLERAGWIELQEGGEGRKTKWKINTHPAHIENARKCAPQIIERRRKEWRKRHPTPQGAAKS